MSQLRSKNLIRKVLLLMVLVLCLAGTAYTPAGKVCASNPNRPALPCCNCDMGGPSPCYECGGCGLAAAATKTTREAQDR
jgi:hypothetical protein